MQTNEFGNVVADTHVWLETQYPHVYWDAWVIMPNHVHGILVLTDIPGRGVVSDGDATRTRTAPTSRNDLAPQNIPPSRTAPTSHNDPPENGTSPKSLGCLMGAFKTISTKQINLLRDTPASSVWQRNYYEHIIRSEASLQRIRHYIDCNPLAWQQDQLHPDNPSKW